MTYYLVERYLPSLSGLEVEAAVARVSGSAMPRHLWTVAIHDEETCLSLFEAVDADAVESANRAARFPFDRVIEAALIDGAPPNGAR